MVNIIKRKGTYFVMVSGCYDINGKQINIGWPNIYIIVNIKRDRHSNSSRFAEHSQASTTVNMYAHSLQSKKAEAISEIFNLIGF
jgi:hypothetical protein